ncbi:MAG: SAM-dependent methyltransferase [Herbinix sp.]|jgi:SAM-dependent methyltransferase|nr:SAM-dependent methyltransferase [Herbinix sp.]
MEKMSSFFTERVDGYDEHMLTYVIGCKEGYVEMSKLIPPTCKSLLDLGCGTGLELDEIVKKIPDLDITGIDLTQAMLDKLKLKYPDKSMRLICGSYFDVPFGIGKYECTISFQTMHHFSHTLKIGLYNKIYQALTPDGIYIECDYMVENQEEENFYFSENARIRKELNIAETEFYHYDTPCTIENQIGMLNSAGFRNIEKVFRLENTTLLVAHK